MDWDTHSLKPNPRKKEAVKKRDTEKERENVQERERMDQDVIRRQG